MRWSLRLGRVSGIKIQVHWTFLILIAWIVLIHVSRGADPLQVVRGVVLVLAVFACVVLHELGHALTAKRFGIGTRDITLLPIGGVARLERMPEQPGQELLVAVAGPAVNVAIAGLLYLGLLLADGLRPMAEAVVVGGNFFVQLMWINVLLVAFNVLPAFPMDGGRMLRALLAYKLDYVRATQIAAAVGQVMAIVFGLVGLLTNPFLLFIAIFVYLGAQAEAQHVQVRVALEGFTVGDAMVTRFRTLVESDTLDRAVTELLAGAQQDFPVLAGAELAGVLRRDALVKSLKELGGQTTVGQVMQRDCPIADRNEPLHDALVRMRTARCSTLPVVQERALVGLLTLANVGELMMVRAAVQAHGRPSRLAEIFATE